MMTVRRFNSLLLLALLTVSGSSSRKVVGRAGEDVTLPCKYNIKYHGPLEVCWGRSLSTFGCNKQIISTDGYKVIETTRAFGRYQLLGRLEDGDVSLTIKKTTKKDAGRYRCRVEIPGPFNDEKHLIDLTIEKAPLTSSTPRTKTTEQNPQTEQTTNTSALLTSSTPTTETTEQTRNTSGQVTATESLPLSSNSSKAEPQQEDQEAGSVPVVLVCVLLALVTAGIVTLIGRRWNQHKISQQQQANNLVWFTSNSSALELHRQGSAVENIYQIDAGCSNSGYEVGP